MNENKLVQKFFKQINKIIDYKLNKLTQIKSAIVHSINQNGTVNLIIPPDKTVYHNIQNQSIYQNLKVGDNVKIIKENNNLSNMWIIGGFGLKAQNLETSTTKTTEALKEIKNLTDTTTSSEIVGKSGIWTYCKHPNGVAECWGRYVITKNIVPNNTTDFSSDSMVKMTEWGNESGIYYVMINDSAIQYPFSFVDVPVEIPKATFSSNFAGFVDTHGNYPNTASHSGRYNMVRVGDVSQSTRCTLDLYVKGLWKEIS